MTIDSKINDSAHYHLEEDDAEIDTNSNPKVATHTSYGKKIKVTDTGTINGNYPHKLLISRIILEIIPVIVPPFNQTNADEVVASGSTFHAVRAALHKEIVMGLARSAARILKDPPVVNWKDAGSTTPQYINTVGMPSRATTPVRIGTGPSVPPISIRIQDIEGPRRSVIPQEVSNVDPPDASINRISSKNRDPTPTWSKVIGRKFANKSIADVYPRSRMNFASDTVLSKSPNFMDLGMLSVNTTDNLGSVFAPTTRIGPATHGSNWLPRSHFISEAT